MATKWFKMELYGFKVIYWIVMPIKTNMKMNKYIPTLEGDEAEDFIRKADENVRLMRQRLCKNHVWRKDYLNGGKKCQVCGKAKEEVKRSKDVEE